MMNGDKEMEGENEEFMAMDDLDLFVMDLDYEFDADCFFDFTRLESTYEAAVAESWFCTAGTYPPAPFSVKSKWREDTYGENTNAPESMTSSSKNLDDINTKTPELNGNREGAKSNNKSPPSNPTPKSKSAGKSSAVRCSTLMKPTASQLAKIKPANKIYPSRSLGRSLTPWTASSETSSRTSPLSVYLDSTKRQKLDIGYLRKVARLKHQNLLLHKLSKAARAITDNVSSRPKPTIPREPKLQTTHRAQRHRSGNNPVEDMNTKLEPSASKARLVNRKVLKNSPLPPENNSGDRSPLFQRPNIQVSESINGITGTERLNNENASEQTKKEAAYKLKIHPLNKQRPNIQVSESINGITGTARLNNENASEQTKKGAYKTKIHPLNKQKLKQPAGNRSSCNPPTELFKKMSLKSEAENNATFRSKKQLNNKVRKENMPASFRQEISVS